MTKTEYREYLRGRHWRRLRMKLKRKTVACELCGIPFRSLNHHWNVHHWTYRNIPKELDDDLSVVCEPCHLDAHEIFDVRETNPFHYIDMESIRCLSVPGGFMYWRGKIVADDKSWFTGHVCIDPYMFSELVHEKIMSCGEGFPA